MQRRLSYAEKGKGLAAPQEPPRTARIRVPAVDNSALIRKHSLTLVGRITNPKHQRMWSLIPFFSEHWKVETKPVGADLGNGCFQFQFASEQDVLKVLADRPYHFAHWMIILQRWEPSTSPNFPNQIPFWIQVQGIPLHLWSEAALEALADDIGIRDSVEITATKARMRVQINGLLPLITKATLDYDTGEEIEATLVYEKIEKYCKTCFRLDHEVQDCPEGQRKEREALETRRQSDEPRRAQVEKQRFETLTNSRAHSNYRNLETNQRDNFTSGYNRIGEREQSYQTEFRRRNSPPRRGREVSRSFSRNEGRNESRNDQPNYHNYNLEAASKSYHSREFRRTDNYSSERTQSQIAPRSGSNRPSWVEKTKQSSYRQVEVTESSRPILNPPMSELPAGALNEAMVEVREAMTQYTNCADPTESAARKERLRQAEELGEIEETAVSMVRASLGSVPEPMLDDTHQTITPTRLPALQRLGPIMENEEVTGSENPPPLASKRKPGRPPGRKAVAASPLNFLGVGMRRRKISKTQPSPSRKKSTITIPRREENRRVATGTSSAGTSANIRRTKLKKRPTGTTSAPLGGSGMDFQNPSSPLP